MTPESRLLASRCALGAVTVALVGLAWLWRKDVARVLRDFFTAATSPTNLAIYRIVFFAAVLVDFGHDYDPATVDFYARLPRSLQTPPEPSGLWGHVLPHLPITPHLAALAIGLLRLAALCATIGLFTRTSAWLVVIFALYVLGIPQYYGKVNHTHHLIWFATILATSRCADVLSADAMLRAWRWAGKGRGPELLEPPAPSPVYALPMRFTWILIGLIYFFPGFHKAWVGGIDWAWSDNFRNRMWEAWYQRDIFADNAWRPIFRLDGFPLLYKIAALGAILFELSWVFMILTSRLRPVAVTIALLFHLGTYFLMRIQFWSLILNFVTFIDWDRILRGIGRLIFRVELPLQYDGRCPGQRRRVALLRTMDVLRAVDYFDAGEAAANPAWGAALLRTPVAWPMAPVLFLLTTGTRREMRSVRINSRPAAPLPRGAVAAFAILLAGNLAFGLKGARDGWPFTCYPTFARVIDAETKQTDVQVLDAAGQPIDWGRDELKGHFSKSRYAALLMLMRDERDEKKMRAFWQVMAAQAPSLAAARKVEFYDVTYSTDPAQNRRELSRTKVWEIDPTPRVPATRPGSGKI